MIEPDQVNHDRPPSASRPRCRTYAVRVLGCKVSQYEAQLIQRRLERGGWRPSMAGEPADIAVLHSCGVTSQAVRKSRQAVRRLRQEHPEARMIVTGCAAAEDLLSGAEGEGVAARIPPRDDWLTVFDEMVADLAPAACGNADADALAVFQGRVRAFLKIQDGCDVGCSFCVVPRLRRAPRDKPVEEIVAEAGALVRAGHREIVVCGVSVGLYGRRQRGGIPLAGVLRALHEVPGLERIRLSSLHPRELTDELLDVWSSSPRMMPHIHLPLQSGADPVLAAMNRGYTAGEFLHAVARAERALDRPAFNTDVIVGFPGESEADFRDTVRVARRAGFARMHVFPYSPRPHTRAARSAADRPPASVVRERCAALRAVGDALAADYRRQFAGAHTTVLVEDYDPDTGCCTGYCERYLPTRFHGPPSLRGRIAAVRIEDAAREQPGAVLIESPGRPLPPSGT